MSYSKLFGSILDSTIWQAPDHVRLVWITMLAMKDQDGIVEASIPGLAKRAGVALDMTQAALNTLQSPDPYSRTPDHEGRRIEPVDGGWRVLNHAKYRDKENQEERREKERIRKAAQREKGRRPGRSRAGRDSPDVSRDVPARPAVSRNVQPSDTDTEAVPEECARSGSGSESPSPSGDPRSGHGDPGDREQASDALHERANSPVRASGDPRADEQRRLLRELTAAHVGVFNRVRSDLGLQVPAMQLVGDPAARALAELLRAQVTLQGFGDRAYHVLAVREAEARRDRSVRWLGAALWNPVSFGNAASMQVGEDRRTRGETAVDVSERIRADLARNPEGDDW